MRFRKALAVLLCLGVLGCAAAWADQGYSQNIEKAVKGFLLKYIEGGAKMFTFDKKDGLFRATLNGEGEVRLLGCLIDIRSDSFISYIISPIGADAGDSAKMANLAEFLCRVNYGLLNGNFDLDFNDGEIRYKSFADCPGGAAPAEEAIGNSIWVGLKMFERYLPGIRDVLNGAVPREALAKCEK